MAHISAFIRKKRGLEGKMFFSAWTKVALVFTVSCDIIYTCAMNITSRQLSIEYSNKEYCDQSANENPLYKRFFDSNFFFLKIVFFDNRVFCLYSGISMEWMQFTKGVKVSRMIQKSCFIKRFMDNLSFVKNNTIEDGTCYPVHKQCGWPKGIIKCNNIILGS